MDTVRFLVSFDGEHYKKEGLEVPLEDFYQKMVDEPGTYPMTAAPSPDDFCQYFEKYAAAGEDVLCICISTKLSSSLQSARIAAQMTEEAYPNARIILLDSLCATLMQSALVLEACRLRDAGLSVEEAARILTDLRKTARIFFTVGSFDYIQHGGTGGQNDRPCRRPSQRKASHHPAGRRDPLFRHPAGAPPLPGGHSGTIVPVSERRKLHA